MTYERINWQNNASTPLNADNLNKMDSAIADLYSLLDVKDREISQLEDRLSNLEDRVTALENVNE